MSLASSFCAAPLLVVDDLEATRSALGERLCLQGYDLPADDKRMLELAAWEHDVVKIGVPEHILPKPTLLTPHKLAVMRHHPVKGIEIVGQIAELVSVLDAIRHHHERSDGGGYPDALRGDAFPFAHGLSSSQMHMRP